MSIEQERAERRVATRRLARQLLGRLDLGYDSSAVRREMTATEFRNMLEYVAELTGNKNSEAVAWHHRLDAQDLYICLDCYSVSNVIVFCSCVPGRIRVLPVALAQKP